MNINLSQKNLFLTGALLIATGIILGAFGAHGLKKIVDTEKINTFEVGVRYQIYHGLAFMLLGIISSKVSFSFKLIQRFMLIGVLFFSGSIYLLVIQESLGLNISKILGPITPIGGLFLIISWGIFILKLTKEKIVA
jgi:uncharacterized membrane protein YgdD (TMEM256/DUF423 family)